MSLFVPFLSAGFACCAPLPPGPPGKAIDANPKTGETQEMKSPFMFREAKLPQGFPPPGPIGQVILKEFPAYRAARVEAPAGQKDASGAMYRPLFRHIKSNNIAMTAPVEMTYRADAPVSAPASMAFLYGQPTMGQTGKKGDVEVVDLPAQTVLSVAVRGGYEGSFENGLEQLRGWLSQHPGRYEISGQPRFLGYNSPFVPSFLRIGEVQIPVTPVADECP